MARIHKIGIVGTGFIAKGLTRLLKQHHKDLEVVSVLTRRDPKACSDFPLQDKLTNAADEMIEKAELVVECSGGLVHATEVIDRVLQANIPCVTLNSEFHITTGSYFVDKGYISEAEGGQPGCLAALHEEVVQMGFKPLVFGNMKSFLNHSPTPDEMVYWSQKLGFSLQQTTAITDGTKLQMEQALIANGMGATISRSGMEGVHSESFDEGAKRLGDIAREVGRPIADFVIAPGQPSGVFITASHDDSERDALNIIRMGTGPNYVLMRNYHLCAYEMVKTVRRALAGGKPLINNSRNPALGVAAIAKCVMTPGQVIKRGVGGFEVRGEVIKVAEHRAHVPVALLQNAVVKRKIEPGQMVTYADVDVPDSLASRIARDLFG